MSSAHVISETLLLASRTTKISDIYTNRECRTCVKQKNTEFLLPVGCRNTYRHIKKSKSEGHIILLFYIWSFHLSSPPPPPSLNSVSNSKSRFIPEVTTCNTFILLCKGCINESDGFFLFLQYILYSGLLSLFHFYLFDQNLNFKCFL